MKFWRNWHRWLGLIVGLQVLLWVSGGVVMSLIPIDLVRGQHLVERTEFSENLITAAYPCKQQPPRPKTLARSQMAKPQWPSYFESD